MKRGENDHSPQTRRPVFFLMEISDTISRPLPATPSRPFKLLEIQAALCPTDPASTLQADPRPFPIRVA